jgi:hypothetical protein
MKSENKVDSHCLDYVDMAKHWTLIQDLMGGTLAMRAASTTWLPMEEGEESTGYTARLNRSILFGGFKDTVENLSSKPFARAINLQNNDSLPEQLQALENNADRTGKSLTQFAREVMESAIQYGLCHILVDYPAIRPTGDEDIPSLATQQQQDIRPYFVKIEAPSLIGWRIATDETGKPILTQIRIQEDTVEPDGEYGEERVERIRVLFPDKWELHTKRSGGDWVREKGVISGNSVGIPLVTFYINPTGQLTAMPPFEDLAFLNLAHWQSDSDQRNILRFARVGLLAMTGLTDEDMERKIVWGPNRVFRTTSTDADIKYVEHSGKAIEAGRKDLEQLVESMEVLGLQPLMERGQGKTATGRAMDEARQESSIQSWIRNLERALLKCYEIAAAWVGTQELPEDFAIDIFSDFGISIRGTEDIDKLIDMREKSMISHETFLREIKRRATLSDSVDIEDEISKVAEEQEVKAKQEAERMTKMMEMSGGDDDDTADDMDEDEDEDEDEEN